MTDRDQKVDHLESLFAAAKQDVRQEPSAAFMARILEDANANQPAAPVIAPPRSKGSMWSQFVGVIGGWPSLAGLVTAAVASVWVGFYASATILPDAVSDILSLNAEDYLLYLDSANIYEPEGM